MNDDSIGEGYFSGPVRLNSNGGVVPNTNSNGSDEMYVDAVRVVIEFGKASSSLLQRRLRLGYARAARLIEEMEERGVIGPADGARPRDVLVVSMEEALGSEHMQATAQSQQPVAPPKTEDEKMIDIVRQLEQDVGFQEAINDYQNWIKMFFEITERKVSVLDAYGDENWDALYEEIATLLTKVYKQERAKGHQIDVVYDYRDYYLSPGNISQRFNILARMTTRFLAFLGLYLEIKFKEYYEANKGSVGKRSTYMSFDSLSGVEFEGYIARLLKQLGYTDVTGTPVTGDQGADLIAKKNGGIYVIQAKRYAKPIGNSAIQEVVGALKFYNGQRAWVITNSTFTPGAVALAQKNDVKLTDGQGIARMIIQAEKETPRKLIQ